MHSGQDVMLEKDRLFVGVSPYWGKARPVADSSGPDHHLLAFHCLDVAAVGRAYLRRAPGLLRWIQERLRTSCEEELSEEAVIAWLAFWLAIHDLGKFSISFQGQCPELVARLQGVVPANLGLPGVRHDSLGMWLWASVVQPFVKQEAWFGDDAEIGEGLLYWARSVMGHHGQPPIEQSHALHRHFRPQDIEAAIEFVRSVRALLLPSEMVMFPRRFDVDAFCEISQELSWWMAGLAVLADWIGSNAEVFDYQAVSMALGDYWVLAQTKAERAVDACGVLPASRAVEHAFDFLFPHIAVPSPLQDWARAVPLASGPQIHLLEDVTGAGKTEAAVMLVHRLMAAGCADGFFIGLPTMATANAMYGRIADLYDRLFTHPVSLVLAHRNKKLVEEFAGSILPPGSDEHDRRQADETATRRCTRWLADHNKRALLAPAGVGTVDQALLAALQSKHQSLRLLGLMHKVLVIDEVHACDAYMQRTLELLLEFHARSGGSAVLLSATLPQGMKSAFLKAFAKGRGQRRLPALAQQHYPLTTAWCAALPSLVVETPVATRPDVRRTVRVRYEPDRAVVIEIVRAALDAGQCVAWIRNTVSEALEAHAELSALIDPDHIVLFHARFTLGDRLDIEDRVLTHFGPASGPQQRAGRLLIATQVAEQSLDIDLDLVVSDLAPIDRLIQRAGRLRRHVRDPLGHRLADRSASDQRGEPCLWVLGPAWSETPEPSWFKKVFPKSARVYPNHGHLWLTARWLQRGAFVMPDDARALIEGVFGDDSAVPPGLQGHANRAEGEAWGDRSLADRNGVHLERGYRRLGLDWSEDTVAPSRLGEDTMDVLLGCWDGGRLLPWRHDKPIAHAWAYSTVKVPRRLIASTPAETDPARQAEIEAVAESLPGGGRWVVLLPLEAIGGKFTGNAVAANARDGEVIRQWRYDARSGLVNMAPDG